MLKALLTPREVAELTHLKIDTVYRLARRGQLPFLRLGNRLRFRRSAFLRWLKHSESPPPSTDRRRDRLAPGRRLDLLDLPSPRGSCRR